MNKSILLIGGGGHCKSVLDTLISNGYYSDIAIIDTVDKVGNKILDVPIIGSDAELSELFKKGYKNAFITMGSIGDTSLRVKLFKLVESIGFNIPNIIDKTSTISRFVELKNGIFIGKNTIINAGSTIQKGSIINSGAIIEHDNIIGEYSHIAPGTTLSGDVSIGNNTHVGANSVIRQQINVGSNTMIGTGSNVISNIDDNKLAYGNPCKEVSK